MNSIFQDIKTKGVLVADGGWGTFLIAAGMQPGECPELWNVNRPEVVREIAAGYIAAGSDIISTNSFGGTRCKLGQFGLGERATELNTAAAWISREAAGPDRHVMASIGPTGKFLMMGDITEDEMYASFAEQARALEAGGADACIVETMSALDEACCAIRAVKENTKLEIVCSFTYSAQAGGGYRTMMGVSPTGMARAALDAGANILGVNCGFGSDDMVEIVRELHAAAPETPILVNPNAGQPIATEKGVEYPETPEHMAEFTPTFIEAGASIIGGCCGTHPGHIRAIVAAVKKMLG